jgi:arylsulfatase A-like enzyme
MGLVHPPFNWDLHPEERHLARVLTDAGYETHLFGLQHVSVDSERLGFSELHGYNRVLRCHDRALGASVSARVEDFLRTSLTNRPLYVEINLEESHRPYDQGGATPDEATGVFVPPYLPAGPESYGEMAALQGAIHQADAAVGRILAALGEAGVRDNTLIVFAADHGLAMPRAKCTLYDVGIEIALLIRWIEGGIMGGRVVTDLISMVDVLPTLLEAVGVARPKTVQGQSFLPPLTAGTLHAARGPLRREDVSQLLRSHAGHPN